MNRLIYQDETLLFCIKRKQYLSINTLSSSLIKSKLIETTKLVFNLRTSISLLNRLDVGTFGLLICSKQHTFDNNLHFQDGKIANLILKLYIYLTSLQRRQICWIKDSRMFKIGSKYELLSLVLSNGWTHRIRFERRWILGDILYCTMSQSVIGQTIKKPCLVAWIYVVKLTTYNRIIGIEYLIEPTMRYLLLGMLIRKITKDYIAIADNENINGKKESRSGIFNYQW